MRKYKRHTIESLKKFAKSKNGKCLSNEYINSKTHLLWECSLGHKWEATSSNILKNKWCPVCSGTKKHSIEVFQTIAENKGGKLISENYVNIDENMEWECAKGHRWFASGNNVKLKNTWCPICAGNKKLGVKAMQTLAKKKNGTFLSKTYTKLSDKYLWKCEKGHIWVSSGQSIKIKGSWCPECSDINRYSINDLKIHAKNIGGRLISKSYKDMDTKYLWSCKYGHQWKATWYKIKNGQWCPKCSSNNITEEKLRLCFESLFNSKFPKSHPNFLRNKEGYKLEYDGYSKKLGIAFEYQGIQHYKKNFFTNTDELLKKRIRDDKQKVKLSIENNVKLFVISYETKVEFFKQKIIEIAKKLNISEKLNIDSNPDYSLAYLINNRYDELLRYVKKKNGVLITKKWTGIRSIYSFKCKEHNYIWETSADAILNKKTWCRKCAKDEIRKNDFSNDFINLKNYAKKNNAKLISKKYNGQNSTYEFLCSKGHKISIPWKERNRRKYFCRECERKLSWQLKFIEKGKKLYDNKYDYSKVVFNKSIEPVVILCPKHGEFLKSPHKHISGKQGCPKCSKSHRIN